MGKPIPFIEREFSQKRTYTWKLTDGTFLAHTPNGLVFATTIGTCFHYPSGATLLRMTRCGKQYTRRYPKKLSKISIGRFARKFAESVVARLQAPDDDHDKLFK